jgi:hypothetical protein
MKMNDKEALNHLAPCGLSCSKCFAFRKGDIGKHSRALKDLLGNFDVYAERFSAFLPQFEDYPGFKRLLTYLSSPDCEGCRKDTCKWPDCGVQACYKEKGVDFCFECREFPCDRTNFDEHLRKRWIRMQERLREIGPAAYYEETKDQSRYR